MDNNPDATAIFSMSDRMMVKTYHVLSNIGLSIPGDMALISISDGKAPYYFYPNITHMRHSGAEVGSTAANLLFESIKGSRQEPGLYQINASPEVLGSV